MSVRILEPQAKPPWQLEIGVSSPVGVKVEFSGIIGERSCQIWVGDSVGSHSAVISVRDLIDASEVAEKYSRPSPSEALPFAVYVPMGQADAVDELVKTTNALLQSSVGIDLVNTPEWQRVNKALEPFKKRPR